MPQVNGSSIALNIGVGDGTTVAKSVSCAITINSDNPDATTKDSNGWAENIYGLRDAVIEADFLSTYDEALDFEYFASLVLTQSDVDFNYNSDTIELRGSVKVESAEEVASIESATRYSLVLRVSGEVTQINLVGDFLLLESGDFLLLESGDQLILE